MQNWIIISSVILVIIEAIVIARVFLTLPLGSKITICPNCEQPSTIRAFYITSKCYQCGDRMNFDGYGFLAALLIANSYFVLIVDDLSAFVIRSIVFAYLLLIFMIDLRYRYIYHKTTVVGFIGAIAIAAWNQKLTSALIGALIGAGLMLGLYLFGVLYAKFKNRNKPAEEHIDEALGFGDVTLSAVLGAFLGSSAIIPTLLIGILLAGMVSFVKIVIMLIKKQYSQTFIAYGPYLIIASLYFLFK